MPEFNHHLQARQSKEHPWLKYKENDFCRNNEDFSTIKNNSLPLKIKQNIKKNNEGNKSCRSSTQNLISLDDDHLETEMSQSGIFKIKNKKV